MDDPGSMPPPVPIGEVAERFRLRKGTLRYYEQLGLLRPGRDAAGRRAYRPADLRRLAFVQLCQDGGLGLADIGRLLDADGTHWQQAVRARLAHVDAELARLSRAREFLRDATRCPAEHPALECPHVDAMITAQLARCTHSADR